MSSIGRFAGSSESLLIHAFALLHRTALGVAIGVWAGLTVFIATVILLLKGGTEIGRNLSLLNQYLIGYSVTWVGSVVGLGYGFLFGFLLGWFAAVLQNLIVLTYIHSVKLKSALGSMKDFLDSP